MMVKGDRPREKGMLDRWSINRRSPKCAIMIAHCKNMIAQLWRDHFWSLIDHWIWSRNDRGVIELWSINDRSHLLFSTKRSGLSPELLSVWVINQLRIVYCVSWNLVPGTNFISLAATQEFLFARKTRTKVEIAIWTWKICDVLREIKCIERRYHQKSVQIHLINDVNIFRCTPFPRERHIYYR